LGQKIEYQDLPPNYSPPNLEGSSSDYIWVAIPKTNESISKIGSMNKELKKIEPYYNKDGRIQVEDRNPQSVSGRTEEQFESQIESQTSPPNPKASEDKEILKTPPNDKHARKINTFTRKKSRTGGKVLNRSKKNKKPQSKFASVDGLIKESWENEIDSRTSPPNFEDSIIKSQVKKTKKQGNIKHRKNAESRLGSDQLEAKESTYEDASSKKSVENEIHSQASSPNIEHPIIASKTKRKTKERNSKDRNLDAENKSISLSSEYHSRNIDNTRSESNSENEADSESESESESYYSDYSDSDSNGATTTEKKQSNDATATTKQKQNFFAFW